MEKNIELVEHVRIGGNTGVLTRTSKTRGVVNICSGRVTMPVCCSEVPELINALRAITQEDI